MNRRSIFASIAYFCGLGFLLATDGVKPPKRYTYTLTEQEARDAYAALTTEADRLRKVADSMDLPEARERSERYFTLADKVLELVENK